jgi:lipoyl(octanoyl) transferase
VKGHLLTLGQTDFRESYSLQMILHRARVAEAIGDTLMITEHVPVFTLGRTVRQQHLGDRWQGGSLAGIPVCSTDRGGSVTYHGPGQLVGYPILKLKRYCPGPKAYMALLEEVLIQALAGLGLEAGRRKGMPGAWVQDRKIGSMGVRISQGVTMHGFALNVVNDLTPFSAVVPCGLEGVVMTSLANESRRPVSMDEAGRAVVKAFQDVFGLSLSDESLVRLVERAGSGTPVAAVQMGGR